MYSDIQVAQEETLQRKLKQYIVFGWLLLFFYSAQKLSRVWSVEHGYDQKLINLYLIFLEVISFPTYPLFVSFLTFVSFLLSSQ